MLRRHEAQRRFHDRFRCNVLHGSTCLCCSVQNRRQPGAGWLAVKTGRHQRWLSYEAQPMIEAPVEELMVARRHEEPMAGEGGRRTDQGFQSLVSFPNRMRSE